jgi:hypothetical protein
VLRLMRRAGQHLALQPHINKYNTCRAAWRGIQRLTRC